MILKAPKIGFGKLDTQQISLAQFNFYPKSPIPIDKEPTAFMLTLSFAMLGPGIDLGSDQKAHLFPLALPESVKWEALVMRWFE